MNNFKCQFATKKENGLYKTFWCSVYKSACGCQRYCLTKKDIEHTPNATECEIKAERLMNENIKK